MKTKRVLLGVVLLLVAAGLVFVGTALIGRSKSEVSDRYVVEGTFESDDADVSSKISGRLSAVLVEEGDAVEAGQLLALLETKEVDAKVAQANGMYSAAKAQESQAHTAVILQQKSAEDQLKQAQAGYNAALARLKMVENGARPQEIKQAESAYKAAQAKLDMALAGSRPQEIAQLEESVNQATAAYNTAKNTYDRFHGLYKEGVIPRQKEEEIELTFLSAKAAMEAAKAKLDMAKEGTRKEDIEQARENVTASKAKLDLVKEGARSEEVEQARQGVNAAAAQLQLAKDAFLQVQLRKQDAVAAGFKASAAKGQLDEAGAFQAETRIIAPISGYVSERISDAGEMVSAGYPIFTITKRDNFKLKVYVDESKYSKLNTQKTLDVIVPGLENKRLRARVVKVAQAADFAVKKATNEQGSFDDRSLQLTLLIQNPVPELRTGMTGRVEF